MGVFMGLINVCHECNHSASAHRCIPGSTLRVCRFCGCKQEYRFQTNTMVFFDDERRLF